MPAQVTARRAQASAAVEADSELGALNPASSSGAEVDGEESTTTSDFCKLLLVTLLVMLCLTGVLYSLQSDSSLHGSLMQRGIDIGKAAAGATVAATVSASPANPAPASATGVFQPEEQVVRASANGSLLEPTNSKSREAGIPNGARDETHPNRERTSQPTHQPTSPLTNAGPRNLLVVVFGLMRTFKTTWPTMRQAIKGFDKIDIVVSTSIKHRCTGASPGRAFRGNCRDEFTRPSAEQYRSSIFDTYEPNLHFLFTNNVLRNEDRILASIDAAAKIRYKVSRDIFLSRYHHVLIIRPDVQFSSPHVDIQRLCASHAGFNIISADWERECFWHRRDWDYGFLACDPKSLVHYFQPKSKCNANGTCATPRLPDGFTGSWKDPSCAGQKRACDTLYCHRAKEFVDNKTRLGNLDDERVFFKIIR